MPVRTAESSRTWSAAFGSRAVRTLEHCQAPGALTAVSFHSHWSLDSLPQARPSGALQAVRSGLMIHMSIRS